MRVCAVVADEPGCDVTDRAGRGDSGEVFAQRLNRVFAVVYPPGRGPYLSAEVVDGVRSRGYRLSHAYLSQLRHGHRSCPSAGLVEALAGFFGVPPGYLRGDDEDYTRLIDRDLWWLAQSRDAQVRELTTLITGLPVGAQRALLAHLDRVHPPAVPSSWPVREGAWCAL